ncbi:DUF6221 family protein [Pseudarthrobacter albicanus]|uniref:DUF6221 family protein n=1 Tax=Pseudarthrobacter albicanus TaxID=2823873 RepID=UPI001BA4B6E4|nr:DUF6221 family protein [Pseudarthrobacter albicanus]
MADLIEFLKARIAEDEAAVRGLQAGMQRTDGQVPGAGSDASSFTAARVLAECPAKRMILGNVPLVTDVSVEIGGTSEYVLMCLASVYSQHPDYQEGWAVEGLERP